MTPGARVQAAIDIIDLWAAGDDDLGRVIAGWGRANRYAGSGDRRAIGDLVHDAVRRLRSAAWVAGADEPAGGRAALEALRHRAPLDLRVNLLKADAAAATAALAAEGIAAAPGPLSLTCLRVVSGAPRLAASRAYRDGLVEIQDAASQAVADYAAARSGESVLDFCAGGGGKTLALAAAMRGQGALYAHDAAPARLAQLGPRAARAGAGVTMLAPGDTASLAGHCDLVLVDAPCSGSGAWRRNPDAKWRLTPARLAELTALQDRVLDQAAAAVRPGGRLVYATCSVIRAENADRLAAFLARHDVFAPGRPPCDLSPLDGGDGFFTAEITRMDGGKS